MEKEITELKFSELTNFQPKQKVAEKTLFADDCKYLLYGGAVGGGKSYWLRWTAVELALYYARTYGIKNVAVGLFSEDYPTLKDRQISKIQYEFPDFLGELKSTQAEGLAFYIHKSLGGGKVLLRNLDDPSKYASAEFAGIGVEELTKNPRSTFDALRHRLRFPGVPDPKFFAATNPGGVGHAYVKKLWVDRDSGDPEQELFKYIPASYRDNEYIETDTYEKQLMGLPAELRKALMEGDWNLVAGQAFGELSERVHLIDPFELPDETRYFAGYDHGFNHPYSFQLFAIVPDGALYLIKHITNRLERPDLIAAKIKEHTEDIVKKGKRIDIFAGGDLWARQRDGGLSVFEQFESAGLKAGSGYVIIRASQDRTQGAQEVRKWLAWQETESGEPSIHMFRNCKDVFDVLSFMQFDDKKPEDVMKMDADMYGVGGDDPYDAFRYANMNRVYAPKIPEPEVVKGSGLELIQSHIKKREIERRSRRWH